MSVFDNIAESVVTYGTTGQFIPGAQFIPGVSQATDFIGDIAEDAWQGISDVGGAFGFTPVDVPGSKPVSPTSFLASPEYQLQTDMLAREVMQPTQGQSAAELMMRDEGEKTARQAASVMASQRGVNPNIAARTAAQIGTGARQQATGQAGTLRAQEDVASREMRETQRANLLNALQANRQAQIDRESIQATGERQTQQLQSAADQASSNRLTTFVGNLGASGSEAAMTSDENQKTNIQDGSVDARAFLDALQAQTYSYKDGVQPGANGERLGVMAQDIEKTPMKYMVVDTDQGKQVDYGQGFGAVLASLADMHGRVKELEGGK